MRVYRLTVSDNSRILDLKEKSDVIRRLRENRPNAMADWAPLPLVPMVLPDSPRPLLGDVNAIGVKYDFPLFSDRAREVLINRCGITEQWLEVAFDEKHYTMLNLTHVVDALDLDRAELTYFKSSGRLSGIERYAFLPESIENEWLFRVKTRPSMLFYTDRFANLIEEQSWAGFRTWPVWDSEHEPFRVFPYRKEIRERPELYGPEGFIKGYEEAWPDEWHNQ